MSKLLDLIKPFIPQLATEQASEEAYLAGSSDLFELERRMQAAQH